MEWPTPTRTTSKSPPPNRWREGVGTLLAIVLGLVTVLSIGVLLFHVSRAQTLYEELTDWLDKTVSISKINYNPNFGNYEIRDNELDVLTEQRKYKSLMSIFLFADAASLFFIVICVLLFYAKSNDENGGVHVTFWIFLVAGSLYTIAESSAFSIFVQPHSAHLPNATEKLLDRSVPYNPGGLMQMEQRLGCSFNHNLYNAFQRKSNPRNTCDPLIASSFISSTMLIVLVTLRVVPIVLAAALMACGRPCGEPLGRALAALRPRSAYAAKYIKNAKAPKGKKVDAAKSTTFDAADKRPPPIISSPSSLVDHTLSYNNAAYFAVSGAHAAAPNSSSRSSDISRCDAADLYNSRLVSEV